MTRDVPKIIIEVSDDLQAKIKHRIIDEKVTMREFVTKAIEDKLKNG